MSLYALGLKQWVEIRAARRPPKALISKVKFTAVESGWIDGTYTPATTWITQMAFKGGKYVASIRKRRFSALTGLKVPIGSVTLIPSSFNPQLLGV